MPHTMEFDTRRQRVTIHYEGTVTAKEYFDIIEELQEFDTHGAKLDGLSIYLGSEVDIDPKEVHDVLDRMKDTLDFQGRNWAFVIEEPRQVAIALLYQMAAKSLHDLQLFSTVEAAVDWLDESKPRKR